MRIHNIFPDEFPESWASDWGEDDNGIFMGFTYRRVRQDFRWIEPGTFLWHPSSASLVSKLCFPKLHWVLVKFSSYVHREVKFHEQGTQAELGHQEILRSV